MIISNVARKISCNFHFSCTFYSVCWCVVSDAEEQKCLDLAGNATALNIRGSLQCVRGLNSRDCMDKIKVLTETGIGRCIIIMPIITFIIYTNSTKFEIWYIDLQSVRFYTISLCCFEDSNQTQNFDIYNINGSNNTNSEMFIFSITR